ncbi:hypothetical protein SOCEGT47_040790 [Sorangium cellulosum]|uniref:Uncharacterized protein n=1 Tax=Sorangium cellulosum TaxID=56 RepID=A0A4V0NDR1_SORCE|nr:hypothetical protein [Sorangium cellulosum]AUX23552.1 hypothetical protein SOCEGT47_040790 [Sorangium cellulosum]
MKQIAAAGSDHPSREASQGSRATTARGASGGLLILMIEDSAVTDFGDASEGELANSPRWSRLKR